MLELKEIQLIELNILKEIDLLCKKNNIRYFLVGGTQLGAVRHKGFIPWDDDIDIGMPRVDYEKFIRIINDASPHWIKIQTYDNTHNFPYNFAKVIDIRTKLVEKSTQHLDLISGVFVDVFPLDGAPVNEIKKKIHYFKVRLLKAKIATYYFKKDTILGVGKKEGFMIKTIKEFVYKILVVVNKFSQPIIMQRKLDSLLKKYCFDQSLIMGNYLGAWGYKELMPREFFGEGKEVIFEKNTFSAVDKTHEYLSTLYGDYMKLPPIEKQKSHHNFYEIILNNRNFDKNY